jgi:hypothetical protein
MWSKRMTRLRRYLRDILAPMLIGIGILLPPPESVKAADPPSPDKQTIEQRVAAVRRHLRGQQQGQSVNVDQSDQTSTERLTQWYNWPNWTNFRNFPNWPNWGNWFNR